MFKNPKVYWPIFFAAIMAAIVAAFVITKNIERDKKIAERDRVIAENRNNPAALFGIVGIKDCDMDGYYESDGFKAALLEGEDFKIVKTLLEGHYGNNIDAILFSTTSPLNEGDAYGVPLLLPLQMREEGYCALGTVTSSPTQLLLKLEKKYLDQIVRPRK